MQKADNSATIKVRKMTGMGVRDVVVPFSERFTTSVSMLLYDFRLAKC